MTTGRELVSNRNRCGFVKMDRVGGHELRDRSYCRLKSAPQTRASKGTGMLMADFELITSKEKELIGSLREEFTFHQRKPLSLQVELAPELRHRGCRKRRGVHSISPVGRWV